MAVGVCPTSRPVRHSRKLLVAFASCTQCMICCSLGHDKMLYPVVVVAVGGEVAVDESTKTTAAFRCKVLVVPPGGRGDNPKVVYALNGARGLDSTDEVSVHFHCCF